MIAEDLKLQVANILWESQKNKRYVDPIRSLIGTDDLELAYGIQAINIERRINQGAKVTGKKIGLTSFSVQKQLGVDQPDYGVLLDTMQIDDNTISASELMQGKAECEIAFEMGKDLDGNITMDRLIESIEYAMISIEVVGSRIANWDIRITDTIADNASASHYILGSEKYKLSEVDLVNCKMAIIKNGELVSEGVGKACMDNPLNAALWLAQKMSENGNPLKKGEVLLSGALGPMVPISAGDRIEASIEGFGSLKLAVT